VSVPLHESVGGHVFVLGGGHVFVLGGGHVFVLGGGHVFVLGGIDFASFYDISIGFWSCSESVVLFCA
jgi:hypothetical protein